MKNELLAASPPISASGSAKQRLDGVSMKKISTFCVVGLLVCSFFTVAASLLICPLQALDGSCCQQFSSSGGSETASSRAPSFVREWQDVEVSTPQGSIRNLRRCFPQEVVTCLTFCAHLFYRRSFFLGQATSAASNGALLEATSTYSAELESVKKNFETLKRGLSAQQVVLSPAPKHSDFGRQGGQRRRGDAQRPMHHTNRHASRSSRSLQTTSAPAPATNARQERGVRTVSQRTTSSQVRAEMCIASCANVVVDIS